MTDGETYPNSAQWTKEEIDEFLKKKVWGKRYNGSGYKPKQVQLADTPENRKRFAGILGISLEELDRLMYEAKSIVCN